MVYCVQLFAMMMNIVHCSLFQLSVGLTKKNGLFLKREKKFHRNEKKNENKKIIMRKKSEDQSERNGAAEREK